MQRIEVRGPKEIQLIEVDAPQPGPRDVVVGVKACGICGSDLKFYKVGGLIPSMAGTPLPIGHEFSGVVEAVGDEVADIALGARWL